MSALAAVSVPQVATFSAQLTPPDAVQLKGVLALQDPGRVLSPFFAALHEAAQQDGLAELSVDVRQLTFVNSSAIRLFVDWATWLSSAGPAQRYVVRFRTDRRITWQRTSFLVLQSLAPQAIVIDSE
jgi:hypothetical protein